MTTNSINNFVDLLRNESNAIFRRSTVKSLVALATLAAGVALTVFMGFNFLSLGIAMIAFSVAVLVYQCSRSSMISRLYRQVMNGSIN
jgi:hypothetical protein